MTQEVFTKYLIIGAGPAGLQMAYFLKKKNRDYVVLEKESTAGAFFATQPVHRNLLSINKKYNYFTEEEFNWRHDWNSLLSDDPEMRFTQYTDDLFPKAGVLYQYLQDFSQHHALNVRYDCSVTKITRNEEQDFLVTTNNGDQYRCKVLLLGLGTTEPLMPTEIEGIELATGYEKQELDLELYKNKRVGIIGGGNSAFETADYLSGVAAYVHILTNSPVKMAWDTHFAGNVRAVNNNIFDMYQLKSMHAVLNPRLRKIEKIENDVLQISHEYDYPDGNPPGTLKLTREYDYIIRCTGWKYVVPTMFAQDCAPAIAENEKYPVMSSSWESESTPDLYFIGAAMAGNDRQAASSFIHGFRYNIRTLSNLLEEKYESAPYPTKTQEAFKLDQLLEWMYTRFSTSAALFQLFGHLSDVLVVSDDLKSTAIYEELPVQYAKENLLTSDHHVFVFTLEFGFKKFDESSITFLGPSDPTDSNCAAFLHPVIRYYRGDEMQEFHFGDSLLARWDMSHAKGGAVTSNHHAFLQWLEARLKTNFDIEAPEDAGVYHKWSEKEKEMWERNNMNPASSPECVRPN
ncbi:MAG: NAD(P)-binding domain-containing protein [Halioglobus sp.]